MKICGIRNFYLQKMISLPAQILRESHQSEALEKACHVSQLLFQPFYAHFCFVKFHVLINLRKFTICKTSVSKDEISGCCLWMGCQRFPRWHSTNILAALVLLFSFGTSSHRVLNLFLSLLSRSNFMFSLER